MASQKEYRFKEEILDSKQLKAENEVRLPWNQEYDAWHRLHFDESIYPNVFLDEMSLMKDF